MSQIALNAGFIVQIARYGGNRWVLHWLFFPLLPWAFLNYFPYLAGFGLVIKPLTQLLG